MFVCVCNGYRESDLRRVARDSRSGVVELYQRLGAGPRCGQCLEFAENVIAEARRGASSIAAE